MQPPVFLPQSVPSAAAAAAAAARGVVGSGVSVTLTPAPAAHSNQHAGFNMPGGVIGFGGVTIKPAGWDGRTIESSCSLCVFFCFVVCLGEQEQLL